MPNFFLYFLFRWRTELCITLLTGIDILEKTDSAQRTSDGTSRNMDSIIY